MIFGGGGNFLSKYEDVQGRNGASGSSEARRRVGPNGPNSATAGAAGSKAAGGRGGTGSGPGRIHVALNSSLVNARSPDRILQVVEDSADDFNEVNTITALHRLATTVVGPRKSSLRRDPRFKKLVHRLSDTLRNAEHSVLTPQDLSNVAWALTKLNLLNAVLFGHLSVHIMRTLSTFQPVNLSMTLWAYARSGFMDEKLFRAAAVEVKNQLSMFQPQQIANTSWAMAKSGFVDEELFRQAGDLALSKLSDYQPMNYSMLLYAFALAKMPHPALYEKVAERCNVQELSSVPSAPNVVTNLALAFSDANLPNETVFESLGTVGSVTLREFRASQISTLVQAFAKVGQKHDKLFASVDAAALSRTCSFKEHELQDILTAYESVGASTKNISKAIFAQRSGEQDDRGGYMAHILTVLAVVLLALWLTWKMTPTA